MKPGDTAFIPSVLSQEKMVGIISKVCFYHFLIFCTRYKKDYEQPGVEGGAYESLMKRWQNGKKL